MEIVLGIGIVVVIGIVVWVLVAWLTSMQKTVQGSTGEVSKRLSELNRQIGEISELGRGIRSLQEFLQSPKLRGNIGEQVLKDMIGQTFPKNSFHLQYSFKSGMKVDAVLKTDAGLLCIDSKFPMENFTLMHRGETEVIRNQAKRDFAADVKKHVTDIGKKYILPEEGTMDFALMYIPSESVYYEIATMEDLMTFARVNRVYPVSPNTLYAHLQVLLLSFQGKELEQKSREVFRLLRAIQKDYEKTGEQLGVLGRHIGNAYNTMSGVTGSFDVLGQKISKTHTLGEQKELEEK
jgi:DNA recombination protein RmuC